MSLRILGGELKGRPLFGGRGRAVRPTLGQVREALFQILAARVPGAVVLDVFAGSGALSFEALSRGAERAVLLERDAVAHRGIGRNIEALGLAERAAAHRIDARAWIAHHPLREFELILVDPPYAGPEGPAVLELLTDGRELHPDALIFWEFSVKLGPSPALAGWEKAVDRNYGDTGITLYRRSQS